MFSSSYFSCKVYMYSSIQISFARMLYEILDLVCKLSLSSSVVVAVIQLACNLLVSTTTTTKCIIALWIFCHRQHHSHLSSSTSQSPVIVNITVTCHRQRHSHL